MLPLVEDVTFAFENVDASLFARGLDLQSPIGGDCELVCMIDPEGSVQGIWFRRTSRARFAHVHKALMEPCGRPNQVPPGMIVRLVIARTEDGVQAALVAHPEACGWVRLTDSYRGENLSKRPSDVTPARHLASTAGGDQCRPSAVRPGA